MAYDQDEVHDEVRLEEVQHDIGLNRMTFSLAMLAGGGVVLMIIALGIGAIYGEGAGGGLIGILFGVGLLAMVSGAAAWFGIVQPQKHFDDINIPAESDHGHGHDDHATEIIVIDSHGNRTVQYESGHSAGGHEQPGEVNVHEPDHQPAVDGTTH